MPITRVEAVPLRLPVPAPGDERAWWRPTPCSHGAHGEDLRRQCVSGSRDRRENVLVLIETADGQRGAGHRLPGGSQRHTGHRIPVHHTSPIAEAVPLMGPQTGSPPIWDRSDSASTGNHRHVDLHAPQGLASSRVRPTGTPQA